MPKRMLDPEESLAAPFYALAALLIAIPLFDFIQSIGALRPGNIQWRFATVGLLSGIILTPLLGVAIAMTVAAVRGHVVFQRILALTNFIAAAVLLILLVGFILDIMQLRGVVPGQGRSEFRTASTKAVLKHACGVVVLLLMGIGGYRISAWRGAKTSPRGEVTLIAK